MAKNTQAADRLTQVSQWVRTGVVGVSLVKPLVDLVNANRKGTPASTKAAKNPVEMVRARIEEQLPLTQAQFEILTKAVADRLEDVSTQARGIAGKVAANTAKVDRRVWWGSGIFLGFIAAGSVAFVITRNRMKQAAPPETYEIPAESNGNAKEGSNDRLRGIVSRLTRRATVGGASEGATATATVTGDDLVTRALFIGNIHTLIYHPKDSLSLPAEGNRIYFLTQAEAESAGYRAASGE